MANQASYFPLQPNELRLMPNFNQSLIASLFSNARAALFPPRQPRLTSRPVRVHDIWGANDEYRRKSTAGTLMIHGLALCTLVAISLWPHTKAAEQVVQQQHIDLVAPDPSIYEVVAQPKEMSGGGGGGDHDKLEAPKGKLPKVAQEQITPPAIVVRNDHPKLAVEPTVVAAPSVKLAEANMPTIGVPESKISGPASNGIGASGGLGAGSSGGVGTGIGAGVGPGEGGGFGGGIYRVGGGVSAPRAIFSPDPDYTEEARKAKYQGTCVLWLVIGADGKPRDVRVARTLGMGLDQKAIEAVRQWKFEPATKDGKPVAVQLNIEVSFHLY